MELKTKQLCRDCGEIFWDNADYPECPKCESDNIVTFVDEIAVV